jgi:hypothetical protein
MLAYIGVVEKTEVTDLQSLAVKDLRAVHERFSLLAAGRSQNVAGQG